MFATLGFVCLLALVGFIVYQYSIGHSLKICLKEQNVQALNVDVWVQFGRELLTRVYDFDLYIPFRHIELRPDNVDPIVF